MTLDMSDIPESVLNTRIKQSLYFLHTLLLQYKHVDQRNTVLPCDPNNNCNNSNNNNNNNSNYETTTTETIT